MVKRLAQVADGHRSGAVIWVVLEEVPPHDVGGIFVDVDSARALLGELGPGWVVEGPIQTEVDVDREDIAGLHPLVAIWCRYPDTRPRMCRVVIDDAETTLPEGLDPTISFDDVGRINVRIFDVDGALFREMDFEQIDAIFFTLSAFDRFVQPYLLRIYGGDTAAEVRDQLTGYISGVGVIPPR